MTYDEIKARYPHEYAEREKDKLRYRYPGSGGESYLDVIERLQPIVVELEQTHDSFLIVTHRVVARALLAYVQDIPSYQMVNMEVPLHVLYCLEPLPFGYDLKAWRWNEKSDTFEKVDQVLFST